MAEYSTILGFKIDLGELAKLNAQLENVQKNLKDITKDTDKTAKTTEQSSKSMSKSWDSVAKSIKGGLLAAIAAAGAALVYLGRNTVNTQKEMASLRSILQSTGGVAGFSAEQLTNLSEQLSKASTVSAGEITEAQTRLLTYTDIVGNEYVEAMQLVVDWSARYSVSVTQAAETVGKALQKPSAAMSSLSRQGFKFTDDFVKKLKEMENAGDLAGAQMLLMNEQLKEGTEGSALALRNTLGGAFDNLMNRLSDVISGDEGSFSGLTTAINDMADIISDPKVVGAIDDLIEQFSGFTAEVSGAITSLVGSNGLAHTLDAIGSTISAVRSTIEAAILAIISSFDGWVTAAKAAWQALRGNFDEAGSLMEEAHRKWAVGEEMAAESLRDAYGSVIDTIDSVANAYNGVERAAKDAAAVDMTPAAGTGGNRGGGNADADKKAAQRAKQLQDMFNSTSESLVREIALYGDVNNEIQMLWDTEQGRYKDLSEAQKQQLLALSRAKDAQVAQKEIDTAREAGVKTYADLLEKISIGETALTQVKSGQITSQEELNRVLEREAFLRDINKQIQEGSLILTQEQIDKLPELYEKLQGLGPATEKAFKQPLIDIQEQFKSGIVDGLGSAFDSLFEGVSFSFSNLLKDLAKQMLKSMVMNWLIAGMGGNWSFSNFKFTGQADGGAWNKGTQFFANGGVVNRATPFGMAGGGLGVMGEAGPEAILPLTRGSDGKLGVAAEGSGGATLVVSPGAVVVNATEDSGEDVNQTAQALDTLINMKMEKFMREQQRPGNTLNRVKGRF